MSESEPALTRTYSTAIARRALLERIQCGSVLTSAHTPMRIRRGLSAFPRLPRARENGPWQGKTVYSSDRPRVGRAASPRPGFESRPWGLDPGKQAPNCRLCTNSPYVWARRPAQALLHEIACHCFDAVSLGQERPCWGYPGRGGGIGRIGVLPRCLWEGPRSSSSTRSRHQPGANPTS